MVYTILKFAGKKKNVSTYDFNRILSLPICVIAIIISLTLMYMRHAALLPMPNHVSMLLIEVKFVQIEWGNP